MRATRPPTKPLLLLIISPVVMVRQEGSGLSLDSREMGEEAGGSEGVGEDCGEGRVAREGVSDMDRDFDFTEFSIAMDFPIRLR